MTDPRSVYSPLGPENFLSSASHFGAHLRLHASHGPIHLQQYDCVPGGWRHDALTSWRIAFQQAGSPRIQRVVERSSERQWRPAGKISISPPNAQSWSWDSRHRIAILFISQDVIDGVASDAGIDGRLRTPLLVDDDLIRQVILEILSECAINSRTSPLLLPSHKSFSVWGRLEVAGIGDRDFDADPNKRFGLNPCLAMNDRCGIAIVGDPLEGNVT
jgi:hypothetical protein